MWAAVPCRPQPLSAVSRDAASWCAPPVVADGRPAPALRRRRRAVSSSPRWRANRANTIMRRRLGRATPCLLRERASYRGSSIGSVRRGTRDAPEQAHIRRCRAVSGVIRPATWFMRSVLLRRGMQRRCTWRVGRGTGVHGRSASSCAGRRGWLLLGRRAAERRRRGRR